MWACHNLQNTCHTLCALPPCRWTWMVSTLSWASFTRPIPTICQVTFNIHILPATMQLYSLLYWLWYELCQHHMPPLHVDGNPKSTQLPSICAIVYQNDAIIQMQPYIYFSVLRLYHILYLIKSHATTLTQLTQGYTYKVTYVTSAVMFNKSYYITSPLHVQYLPTPYGLSMLESAITDCSDRYLAYHNISVLVVQPCVPIT